MMFLRSGEGMQLRLEGANVVLKGSVFSTCDGASSKVEVWALFITRE